jgi:uncharacterized OsmC-like protein/alpha-beta hydrolase superfamily lysophospholipase
MNSTTSEKITFPGSQGHSLAARLERPVGEPRAYALFAHCFTCSKDIFAASRIAGELAGHGIAVLRFDFTGLGSSEGEFSNTNFSSNVGDLVAAARFLADNFQAPEILIGHSLGGAAVLAAAAKVPSAVAVATIGAPSDPAHVSHLFADARQEIECEGEAEVTLGGRQFRIQKQFVDDISENNLDDAIAGLKKALLVFHAPLDETVSIDNAGHIFQAAKHPKSFVSLDDADHLLSRRQDSRYVAAVLAAWAMRFIGDEPAENLISAAGTVVVAENGIGRFSQSVSVNNHHQMYADEPESYGGNDSGPSPYDYLLAGLGACTAMTMRMYAERKKIPLEHVSVTLRHNKVHAEDCADCHATTGKVDRIEREIEIVGDLDEATRNRLLEIADKCPVHRTLHSEVLVTSRLVD